MRAAIESNEVEGSAQESAPMKLRRKYELKSLEKAMPYEDERFHDTKSFNKIRLKKQIEIPLEK